MERQAAFLFLHQPGKREKKDMDLRRSKVGATTASSAVDITGLTEQCTSWWGNRAVSLPVKRILQGELPSVVGEALDLVRSQKVKWGEKLAVPPTTVLV